MGLTSNLWQINQQEEDVDNYHSSAIENDIVVATGAYRINNIFLENTQGTSLFLQLFDAAAVPASGATPVFSYAVPGLTVFASDQNIVTDNGIVLVLSSTRTTYTPHGTQVGWYNVEYKQIIE